MFSIRQFSLATLIALYAGPALSGIQMWNFSSWSQDFSSAGIGNSLTLTSSDGVTLTATGWSDTNGSQVESAEMIWANNSALGVRNQDEVGQLLPHTSVDSMTAGSEGAFDMLLLEFSTEVSLAGLDLNWAMGGSSSDTADISVLAWDGIGQGAINSGSWGDILSSNGGNYDSLANFADVDLSYFAVDSGDVTSSKWLIGAYNPVFGSGGGSVGDDGIALASLSTSTRDPAAAQATEIPLPGTLLLLAAGLGLVGLSLGSRPARRSSRAGL